jgi:hypothetical protein
MNIDDILRLVLVRNQLVLHVLRLEEAAAQERIRRLENDIGPGRGHGDREDQRHFAAHDVYTDILDQGDSAFLTYTRFTLAQFNELFVELRYLIERNRRVRLNVPEPTGRRRSCKNTPKNRLLMVLKWLVQGGHCDELGVEFGVDKHVVHEDILHVVYAICEGLRYEIHWPLPGAETIARKGTVSAMFPAAIGYIDCTHTPSPRQPGDFSGHHRQAERGHQVLCDPLGFVLHVTARHDSYRYRRSEVPQLLELADAEVLGDDGYKGMQRVRLKATPRQIPDADQREAQHAEHSEQIAQ